MPSFCISFKSLWIRTVLLSKLRTHVAIFIANAYMKETNTWICLKEACERFHKTHDLYLNITGNIVNIAEICLQRFLFPASVDW